MGVLRFGLVAVLLAGLGLGMLACELSRSVSGPDNGSGEIKADVGEADSAPSLDVSEDLPLPEDQTGEIAQEDASDSAGEIVEPPGDCCDTDQDCDDGLVCVVSEEAETEEDSGLCLQPAQSYRWPPSPCWSGDDCGGTATCSGATVGKCSAPGQMPQPGGCVTEGCCFDDANCPEGSYCDSAIGACVPVPPQGECFRDEHCPQGNNCVGSNLCPCVGDGYSCIPCEAPCGGPDKMGVCMDLNSAGCCQQDADCPGSGKICVGHGSGAEPGWGVCVQDAAQGWCWADDDCSTGEYCHNPSVCGCLMDCDMAYEGPGICAPSDGKCLPVKQEWVLEYCDAASVVIWTGQECVSTCPGCCSCHPFCDFTFDTMEDCQSTCSAPSCAVWDGSCDDAVPDQPWWYFDGSKCLSNATCTCEGCPGVFATKAQCENACGIQECDTYIAALADCPYGYSSQLPGPECPITFCLNEPCIGDADCPLAGASVMGDRCVLGSCVYCWEDSQCSSGEVCRAGRCVPANPSDCAVPPVCDGDWCGVVSPSELPCPVCVCDSLFNRPCSTDMDCLLISSYQYKRCVYGRCTDCRNDGDCAYGNCLSPGVCFDMLPSPVDLYGTWLIGWGGGLDHFSYFRFEPDGTLRRGSYTQSGAWSDDIPVDLPCYVDGPFPSPLVGTWEPEITQSGFLAVRMNLNLSCDAAQGWSARYLINLPDSSWADFTDIDGGMSYMAQKVSADMCLHDFSQCQTPSLFW